MKRLLIFLLAALLAFLGLSASHPALPKEAGQIYFYSNQQGNDLRLVLQEAFQGAKKSIAISMFNFSDRKLITSLKEAEERGVEVTIFADESAIPLLRRVFKNVNEDVYIKGLMHRKIVIIDEHLALIGSANFTKDSLQVHENILLALESPSLCTALLQDKGAGKSYPFPDQTLDLWLLPEDREAEKELIGLINTAEKTLKVAMFTWTSEPFASAVVAAHKRGVQVEVALDRQSSIGTSRKIAQLLQKEGIPLFQNQGPGLLHHKFALIDDRALIAGSANWTASAFKKNAEVVLVLNPLGPDQQLFFEELWDILTLSSKMSDQLG